MARFHALLLGMILLAPSAALADGVMFTVKTSRSGEMVRSPRQEALLATDGQTVQVVLRTHFRRGPEELAWVVPVPARPFAVTQADDAIFTGLDEATAPRFRKVARRSHLACGCGGMAANLATDQSLVSVEAVGVAGIFEYAVLASPDATALTDWLTQGGYHVPPTAARSLARYARDGWHFLAMRVRPELLNASSGVLAPHPISYQYRSGRLVFPLEVSQASADDRNEILLHVLARQRFTCTNWPTVALGEDVQLSRRIDTAGRYQRQFAKWTADHAGRLFVVEYADRVRDRRLGLPVIAPAIVGELGDCWLTRLRAVVRPGQMDRDVELSPAGRSEPVRTRVWDDAEAAGVEAAAPLALVGMLCYGRSLLRRRRWGRLAGVALLAVACVGLATM